MMISSVSYFAFLLFSCFLLAGLEIIVVKAKSEPISD